MKRVRVVVGVLVAIGVIGLVPSHSQAGMSIQGMSIQGMSIQGMSIQGMSIQGMSIQGMSIQGMSIQGMSIQGMSIQGMSIQGMSIQGMSIQGMSIQGMSIQGMSIQGMSIQGMSIQGMSLRGVDRLRGYGATLEFRGIERADAQVPGNNLQAIQTGAPINYVPTPNPMQGVRLQAGPTNPNPGSFLFVPTAGGAAADLEGTFWNLVFYDTTDPNADDTHKFEVIAYVAGVEVDTSTNSSASPSNGDVYLYTVYFRDPATGQWSALCPTDEGGKARAMVTPLHPNEWTGGPGTKLGFACTASGVAAKCARNWGYKPWVSGLASFYNACLIAARADYCQDDQSFTRDGTPVDLFDQIPSASGLTFINRTVGLSVDPFEKKPMLHEEYQISIDGRVIDGLSQAEIEDLQASGQLELVERLARSGLQSSRYPDLDPGRSCAAAPYIDRCTSLSCQRAANMQTLDYGAFMAVNSPRHCGHRENETGEPMLPACSACTSRICEIDPTCCGDPGDNPFPGSLVWDGRCAALREQVCRSTPVGVGTENVWPLGVLAEGSVGKPAAFRRGVLGGFEGIVTEGGVQFVEGWSCDPDFPLASNPVQISVGGVLGGDGATLLTATADQPLVPSWREIVAAECGGGERHGFRVALPNGSAGREVFVYGIDLNVPGAPFSLLRGGKKTAPGGGSVQPDPRAAIFTGWVEPAASGEYLFNVDAGGDDKFRLWVNGLFVAGNWKDPDTNPPTPGAFLLDPPSPPPMPFLQKGVRYAVRLEYLRPDAPATSSSHLAVTWSLPNANPAVPPQPIPTTALYAMAQSGGTGLQGTFFPGVTSLAALPPDSASTLPRTFGVVDHVWNDGNPPIAGQGNPPIPGVSVGDSFGARFEGQLVPPISGEYKFSLDTDGDARIFVNGQHVAAVNARPERLEEQCSHDLCVTGAPISDVCEQSEFCASVVCAVDIACCTQTWDARCVEEVKTWCELDICTLTVPAPVTLQAGWKYDVRVEYQHQGSAPSEPVRGAKLKLMWSLATGPRDVIPAVRLFAAAPAPAPQLGTGLNAAYFADPQFQQPILDHVEANLAFDAASPPVAMRAGSLICGNTGAPACGQAPVPNPPALASATTFRATDGTIALTLQGGGAAPGASLTVFERKTDGTLVTLSSPAMTTTAGGAFTTAPLAVERRRYVLQARQSVGGQTSVLSDDLQVNVTDPDAPPPPTASGSTAADGTVTVGGTAAPLAGVNVSAKVEGTAATFASRSFTADGSGNWTGIVPLPPGSYDLTITQTSADHTSDAARTVNVKVPVPVLTVTAPADNLTLTCPTQTCLVTVSGGGASTSLGPIVVADGDGRFFVDLPTEPKPLQPNADGSFTGQVALDRGRHMLKIFQRANGLAGDAEPRAVLVNPSANGIVVQSPIDGEVIVSRITVAGTGPARQGLPGKVRVYQLPRGVDACPATSGPAGAGAVLRGEDVLDDAGGFGVPIFVTGVGRQCLAVSHTASSLSGAGAVESDLSPVITVRVRPARPQITTPLRTGTLQPNSLSVLVEGTAQPGSTVTIFGERPLVATASVTAEAPNGTFAATLAVPAPGTYRLTAIAEIDGAASSPSEPPVVIAIGDVIPPTLKVADPADPDRKPVREIPVATANDGGADFNFRPWVTAIDPSPDGGAGVALDAARIVCQPAAGSSVPHFPLGATQVTCTATDSAGNSGSTRFLIMVRSVETPVLAGSNLTAEAQGPAGAVVNYQITATGLLADCSPAGSGAPQSCSAWRPASKGLGVRSSALAMDPATGDLYAGITGVDRAHLLRSTNGGGTWQELTAPAVEGIGRILVQSGSPVALYVSPAISFTDRGLHVSRDGGQSWTTVLNDVALRGVAQDPRDAAHLLAWSGTFPSALYETRNGGTTWEAAGDGLPDEPIQALAMDPVNPDRMYLSLEIIQNLNSMDRRLIRIFRRTDRTARWRERPIFPFDVVFQQQADEIFVSPSTGPCLTGDAFPAVFAGALYSCDGGENWQEIQAPASPFSRFAGFGNMAFDRNVPGRIYAASVDFMGDLFTSSDHGRTWTGVSSPDPFTGLRERSLVQGPTGGVLYAADLSRGIIRSDNGGQSFQSVAAGLPAGGRSVSDVAVDPADPAIAYAAFGNSGVYRTTSGGETWEASNENLQFVEPAFSADKVVIHPLARNVVFSGSVFGFQLQFGPFIGLQWGTSSDSATTWTALDDQTGNGLFAAGLAADPLVVGGWLSFPPSPGLAEPTLRWPTGAIDHPFWENIFRLQMVPDASRTVVASLVLESDSGFVGPTALFSFRDLLEGAPFTFVDPGLLGPANVVYDGSDGTHRLFVSGTALGRDPNLLYRASVDDLWAGLQPDGWEELVGDGVFPAFQRAHDGLATQQGSFTTLVIDPVGGGQIMYTLGSENTLWESRDGGRTWRRDAAAPGFVTAAWLSPVDGALYAAISPTFADTARNFYGGQASGLPTDAPGVLWKRAARTSILPGTQITRGDLRVSCQGPAGFPGAIGPGATFPLGETRLSCSATDAFGNVGSRSFAIVVRDTTGPALTVPPDITLNGGCSSPQTIGTATATDAVSPPVSVTSNRPSIFRAGTTVVTYTARDARGNTTTRTQRVTVLLGDDQSCCPTGTTIRRGTSNNDTITGTAGRDCILGLGGQDTINGGGGDDVLSGGEGDDVINGGAGNDQIFGGGGQDRLNGDAGNDVIDGRDSDDTCRGGDGDDTLRGGNGNDRLFGDNGPDQLFGDAGDDRLEGGAGNDALNGGANNDVCIGGTGTNTIAECSP